ncbi:MAG: AMP-binding protein [Betaproteobacteria bacterium]|nr:AMP-binding protein [Betaproteobacteria bacterium]MBK8107577.1 AMP-binding protein [Betaproteobacteria bacterium]
MNLAQLLVRAARVHPERPAVLVGDRPQWTYRELADRTSRLAGHLRNGLGLQPGDRVAVYMTNHVAYLEVLYAAWWAGLAVVPINAKLHPREVEFILGDAGAAVLFVSDDLAADLQPLLGGLPALRRAFTPGDPAYETALAAPSVAPAHRAPDDLAWLFYTSGTTGRPKGVMQTHRNLYAMTSCYFIDVDDVQADDAIVYAAPMSHGAGMYNFAFVARAARHIVPASGGFDPAELVALSQSVGRLCLFAAPTMVKRLVEHIATNRAPADGFKTLVYGGGPMYAQDIQAALTTMGPRFVQIYGQGESPMTITALARETLDERTHPRWAERIASVGVAQTLVEVRVAGPDGQTLPTGETGEVVVRGEAVMAGYWRNPEATAQALRDGWLWTGDMGAMDADGYLTLKDRSKDVIISGGSNIYPREVEEVLLRHPGVREVSVIGQPDAEWGEVVVACVVGSEVTAAALDALCLEHIARFKRPKRYHFVAELPKNNYGKVLKTALRDMLHKEEPTC